MPGQEDVAACARDHAAAGAAPRRRLRPAPPPRQGRRASPRRCRVDGAEAREGGEAAIGAGDHAVRGRRSREGSMRWATSSGCSTKLVVCRGSRGSARSRPAASRRARRSIHGHGAGSRPRTAGRRLGLQQHRHQRGERDVARVRAFVVAPADMQPHAARDVAQRVVEDLDVDRGPPQEAGLVEIA